MSENAALIKYYAALSIIQYADKPKARAHMENLLGKLMCYDLAISVRDGFNIETAVGKQLDIIAKYVGVSRIITGTAFTRQYFGFAEYGDVAPFTFSPFIKYGDPIPDVQFRNYKESSQSLYALNDEELRIIIKLAILRNNSNASVKDIDELLNMLFGANVYFIDRMNMTVVSYMLSTAYQRIFNIAKSSGLLPNPAGVGTSLVVVPDITKIFSFSLYGGAKPIFAVGFVDYFPKWSIKGNAFSAIKSLFISAGLSSIRIAAQCHGGYLQAYDFDGDNWATTGNALSISTSTHVGDLIIALSSSRVAFFDSPTSNIKAYDFDGINWTIIGTALPSFGGGGSSMASLSSTRIAFFNRNSLTLRTYDFDGTNWTATGNALSISANDTTHMVYLSSSKIALYHNGYLQTYNFDGTNWTSEGNALLISFGVSDYCSMAFLSSTRISIFNHDSLTIQAYDFDGTNWTTAGNDISVSSSRWNAMASLSETRIAFCEYDSSVLQTYDFIQDLTGCMASYS